jgi:hypothetical protein
MSDTFIPVNFDDVHEASPQPGGRYDLQIVAAEVAKTGPNSKVPGSPQFKVSIAFADPDVVAPTITQFVSLPNEQDEKKSSDFKVLLLKRFLTLFSVPYDRDGINVEKMAMDMVGCTANAEVTLTDPDDNGNVYNRLVVPRMRDEGTPTRSRR